MAEFSFWKMPYLVGFVLNATAPFWLILIRNLKYLPHVY